MRAVLQRVQNATVTVDDLVVSAIGTGLVAWIGFGAQDTNDDLNYMVNTLLTTRFYHAEHSTQRWTRTVMDKGQELLILSQISLYSMVYLDKPFFYQAMGARRSKSLYERFIKSLKRRYKSDKIREGRFGAGYTVSIQSKGPVFIIESPYSPQYGGAGGPPPPGPYKPPAARGAPSYGAPPYYGAQAPPQSYSAPQTYGAAPPPYGAPPPYAPPYGAPSYSYGAAPSYNTPSRQSQTPYNQYPAYNYSYQPQPPKPYSDYPNY
ncbi:D-aminoacyl-tRNA deacylase-like [Macrosteles quadrilineatus]|uniref:D-aminoacyl-tRNA deacylase-like n=1 Tax=Macrosteles quadrilineatus TaxID=74068 RepID=UPI0023E12EB2|nr:D-aminoacyl-tRNA deacylase-like [Macrosteles quadrilineatus]